MPSLVVAERSVAYWEAGPASGVPVVFVPGSFTGGSVWRRLISRLDPERVRAITLDLPGCGASDAAPDDGLIHVHQAAAIEALLAKAIGEPVHLVAHSHGANVALVAATAARIRLRSLTLFEPLPIAAIPDRADILEELRAFLSEYRRAYEAGDRWIAGRVIDLWAGPGTFEAMSLEAREAVAARTAVNIREWQDHFDLKLPLGSFRALSIPTTIVVTERGHRTARAIGEALHRLVPASTLVEIAGASHAMIHSHADDSAAIVRRAIALTA